MGFIKQNLGTAVLALGLAAGWAAPARAALETIDLTAPSTASNCQPTLFGTVCYDQKFTLLDGSFMTASAINSFGGLAKVERYNSGGVAGLGVDSGLLDFDDSVDFSETLVLTFSAPKGLYGWSMTDTGLFSGGGPNKFSLSVDGGAFVDFDIGDYTPNGTQVMYGSVFSFKSKSDDSFVLSAIVVPEPSSLALTLATLAIGGFLVVRQRGNSAT